MALKDTHVLNPGACDYIILITRRKGIKVAGGFKVAKLLALRQGECLGAARGPTVLTGSSRAVKREVEDVALEEGHGDATQLALKMEEGP